MLKETISIGLLGLLVASCSGWSSELDTAFIDDGKSLKKPICEFEVTNNCWSQSLKLIQHCAPVVADAEELLTADNESCKSSQGKQINFIDDSLDAFLAYEDHPLHFKVYNGQKTCFELYGRPGSFSIESDEFGALSIQTLASGDIQVSCFFNEGFVIPKDAQTLGCRGQKAAPEQVTPAYGLNYEQQKDGSGGVIYDQFQFFFVGGGASEKPLFNCHR